MSTEIPGPSDELLAKETDAKPGIKFLLAGTDYELPRPLPMRVWLGMFIKAAQERESADPSSLTLMLAAHAEDVMCNMTGLTVDALRGMDPAEYERVLGELVEQMGEELADASPFSTPHLAIASMSRAKRMTLAMSKAGGGKAS